MESNLELLVVAAFLLLPVIAILLARKDRRLRRIPYVLRTILSAMALAVGINFGNDILNQLDATPEPELHLTLGMIFISLLLLSILVAMITWTVYRLQDIGWSKFLALGMFLPFIGIFVWLTFAVRPGRPAQISPSGTQDAQASGD